MLMTHGSLLVREEAPGAHRGHLPGSASVMERARSENFPVALRVLPRRQRSHLMAVYGFARLADQIGDDASGDRLAHLDWLEAELRRAFRGRATHPILCALEPALREASLPERPFLDLIAANRADQTTTRYATWDALMAYCALSANPVGRLVLAVFGAGTPAQEELSDRVSSGLQVVEHCQDVAEDLRRGRVYLPQEDMERFGCREDALSAAHASPELRAVIALQAARARRLLGAGARLARTLPGAARLALAAFAGGGLAALDAIEAAGFDVLAGAPRAGRARVAWRAAGVLAEARGTR